LFDFYKLSYYCTLKNKEQWEKNYF
jgi:hypothetical protein